MLTPFVSRFRRTRHDRSPSCRSFYAYVPRYGYRVDFLGRKHIFNHRSFNSQSEFYTSQPATGLTIATFKPKIPATLPTGEAVIEGAIITKSDIVFSVPSFVEVAQSPTLFLFRLRSRRWITGMGSQSGSRSVPSTHQGNCTWKIDGSVVVTDQSMLSSSMVVDHCTRKSEMTLRRRESLSSSCMAGQSPFRTLASSPQFDGFIFVKL